MFIAPHSLFGLVAGILFTLAAASLPGQEVPSQVYAHGDPTVYEQYMLEMVNRARLNPAGEARFFGIDLNEGPPETPLTAAPKQPLAFNPHLLDSARQHSQWMLDRDVFSHVEDDGSTPQDRMQKAGYIFSGAWANGENIAYTGVTGTLDLGAAILQNHQNLFVDAGVGGRGHRVNLLDADFREIGIGVEEGVFSSQGTAFNTAMITQDFGATGTDPAAFLVGVVYRDLDGNGFYSPGEGLVGVRVTPSQGTYYAVTSASGGYAIPLGTTSGTLAITISQGSLAAPITKTVALTGQNVKLDFETIKDTPAPVVAIKLGLPRITPAGWLAIHVTAVAGLKVELQASSDLNTWQAIQTVTLVSPETDLLDALPSAAAAPRFYRATGR
jgi:hypothetical protein